jgi:hypothetical protein
MARLSFRLNLKMVLQNFKIKKRSITTSFSFAPPIGESYNFNAMISYSIILKSMV